MSQPVMVTTLRRVADLLAAHPELPTPYVTVYDHIPDKPELKWYLHINDKGDDDEQRATAAPVLGGAA